MVLKTGDIYYHLLPGSGYYSAVQITGLTDNGEAAVLCLDYYDKTPPSHDLLPGFKPLLVNHHSWADHFQHFMVRLSVPASFVHVGNRPVLVDALSKDEKDGWGFYWHIAKQRKWERLPEETRKRYKEADSEIREVLIEGETYYTHNSRVSFATLDSPAPLAQLPCLTEIYCNNQPEWLIDYINGNPLIARLTLRKINQSRLDFSDSSLEFLYLNCDLETGQLEEVRFDQDLQELSLSGTVPESLQLHPHPLGRPLTLHLTGLCPPSVTKPIRVRALYLSNVDTLDFAELLQQFPNLEMLRIWGKPGIAKNIGLLTEFACLKEFSLMDMFGFDAAEFPSPEKLPKLRWLWLTSVPKDLAEKVKREYKGLGIDLDVSKPRTAEWLAENLDNPFRSWDGDGVVTTANSKKAAGLYRDFKKTLHRLKREVADAVVAQATLLESVRTFTLAFNKMDGKRPWIDTIYREDIAEALELLLKDAEELPGIDRPPLWDEFEKLRDF